MAWRKRRSPGRIAFDLRASPRWYHASGSFASAFTAASNSAARLVVAETAQRDAEPFVRFGKRGRNRIADAKLDGRLPAHRSDRAQARAPGALRPERASVRQPSGARRRPPRIALRKPGKTLRIVSFRELRVEFQRLIELDAASDGFRFRSSSTPRR